MFGVVSESWFEVGFHSEFLPEPLFQNHFRNLFQVFSIVFSFASVVEAAPQARPKTTAVANTALSPSPCSPPSLNALPVPMLRQVEKKDPQICFFMILGAFLEPFWSSKIILKSSNSISLCFSLSGGLQGPFWDHFWFNFGVIWGHF